MKTSRLIRLISETGYWSDNDIDDNTRYSLLDGLWSKLDGNTKKDLQSLLWSYAGRPKADLIDYLESRDRSKTIKKSAPTVDKAKSPRDQIKDSAAILADIYITGQNNIHDVVLDALSNNDTSALKIDIADIRSGLLDDGRVWIDENIPNLYRIGSSNATGKGHTVAITALSLDALTKLREADQTVGRFTDQVIARLKRMQARGLLTSEPHWVQNMIDDLNDESEDDNFIPGHKTIDGKILGLAAYAATLAIVSARDSYNEGKINNALEQNQDLMRISPEVNNNTCESCSEWAGKVVSLTGDTPDYPTLDETYEDGMWHPHCVHVLQDLDE